MKSKFENSIKLLHYVHKTFGMSYFVVGHFYYLELIYLCLVFIVYLFCALKAEYNFVNENHVFMSIKHVVLMLGTQSFTLSPVILLLRYRLINGDFRLLIETANRLCNANLSLTLKDYRKIRLCATLFHICYLIYCFLMIGDMQENRKFRFGYIEKTCLILTDICIFLPGLQFFCWILLFKFLFNKTVHLLLKLKVEIKCTTVTFKEMQALFTVNNYKIRQLLRTLHLLLNFKTLIIKTYNVQVIIFLCHLSNGLVFELNEVFTFDDNGLYRPFLFARLTTTIFFTVLIFWISESSIHNVSVIF